MESIYLELALYGSKNECTKTDIVFFPISAVWEGMVSLQILHSALVLFHFTICTLHTPLCTLHTSPALWTLQNAHNTYHTTHYIVLSTYVKHWTMNTAHDTLPTAEILLCNGGKNHHTLTKSIEIKHTLVKVFVKTMGSGYGLFSQ